MWLVSISSVIASIPLIYFAVRACYHLWWRPKSLERQLGQQGIHGNPYKLLYGDLKEQARILKEAWSKPCGLTHSVASRRALPAVHATIEKYGKKSLMWIGTTPRVILWDAEVMKEILSEKSYNIQKPPAVNPLINLLAMGISSLEGDEWACRRKMINPAFHMEKLKGMVPSFIVSCKELIERWQKLIEERGVCELDVWTEFQNLTGDVISRTAFGSNYEEGKMIFELQKEQANLVLEAARSVYIPGLRLLPTAKNKRRMYLDREITAMLKKLIRKKEVSMRKGDCCSDDLLGLLLQNVEHSNIPREDKKMKYKIRVEDVIEECKLFYFAGQETTSVWLTWTVMLLAMHPSWQEKARKEIQQICEGKQPDFESMNHLKIVTMILNEVQRLYPPVAGLFRYKATKLGGINYPPGVEFLLPTIFIHHDSEYWGEDAAEFNPERFAHGVSKASKDQNAFFPFGWGPRVCLGQNFAIIEAKMALAMILKHFSFELSPSYAHAPYTVITLQPQYGAQIILKRL